jgi:hypothetical protein
MMKFNDWLLAKESSAFTRLRRAAALGLAPPIPDASINSRSTAAPWELKALKGKGKKKKKKKSKKNESFSHSDKGNFQCKYWTVIRDRNHRPQWDGKCSAGLFDENGMYMGVKEGFFGFYNPGRNRFVGDINKYWEEHKNRTGYWKPFDAEVKKSDGGYEIVTDWKWVYDKVIEEKVTAVKHVEIDGWLGEVDKLKATLETLKKVMADKKKKPPVEKEVEEKDVKKGEEEETEEPEVKEKELPKKIVVKKEVPKPEKLLMKVPEKVAKAAVDKKKLK